MVTLAITPGCPSGIGPEVTAKALAALPESGGLELLYSGHVSLLEEGARISKCEYSRQENRIRLGHSVVICDGEEPGSSDGSCAPGKPNDTALSIQRQGLQRAMEWAKNGRAHGIVTAPIRKASIQNLPEGSFPGQTELLHHHLAADDQPPLMCFLGGPCVLGLCTIHVPLADVSPMITSALVEKMSRRLLNVVDTIKPKKEKRSQLVVLGLNPHAGEGGLLGSEDSRVIEPAIKKLSKAGLKIKGPVPADGFFARMAKDKTFDESLGVLAMYHDQGLGPYKVLAGGASVNLTWGLSVPRTSPDHGTADDIAGQGMADERAMLQAIIKAKQLAESTAPAELKLS